MATAVGNEVWMLENATYSILSPEGFASILWKDAGRAKEASGNQTGHGVHYAGVGTGGAYCG